MPQGAPRLMARATGRDRLDPVTATHQRLDNFPALEICPSRAWPGSSVIHSAHPGFQNDGTNDRTNYCRQSSVLSLRLDVGNLFCRSGRMSGIRSDSSLDLGNLFRRSGSAVRRFLTGEKSSHRFRRQSDECALPAHLSREARLGSGRNSCIQLHRYNSMQFALAHRSRVPPFGRSPGMVPATQILSPEIWGDVAPAGRISA